MAFAWVYAAFLAVVAIGRVVRARTGVFAPVIAALGAGFMFFVVTNLAVFAGDLYPHTWAASSRTSPPPCRSTATSIVGDVAFNRRRCSACTPRRRSWYARRIATT